MPNPSPQYLTVTNGEVIKTIHPVDLQGYIKEGFELLDQTEMCGIVKTTSNYPVAGDEPMQVAFSPSLTGEAITVENGVPISQGVPAEEAKGLPPESTLVGAGQALVDPEPPQAQAPTPVVIVDEAPKVSRRRAASETPKE